jgi:RNA polymerase sigma-70 factor (ECF subfamily)
MELNVENIWVDYRSKINQFVRSRVGDYDVAEDITQDVFVKIFNKIDSLQSKDKLQSWLYQIARNAIVDYYRTKKVTTTLPELPQVTEDSTTKALKELSECLLPMIDKLPLHYKETILLSEIDGKTHSDISRTLGISTSGSKSRVQRGRVMLKEMMMDCCRLEFDNKGKLFDYEQKNDSCDNCR